MLVGGSTRIPKVQQILSDFFGKQLTHRVNPDEAVAIGATILAAKLQDEARLAELGEDQVKLNNPGVALGGDLVIKETIAHNLQLQVECDGDESDMSCIIPRGTQIPCSLWQYYVTGNDNQTEVQIPVYQGDSAHSYENKEIACFMMNIDPRPANEVERFTVTFEYDNNSVLNVTCKENFEG